MIPPRIAEKPLIAPARPGPERILRGDRALDLVAGAGFERPSGYEATEEGLQTGSNCTNPSESVDSLGGDSAPPMQAASSEHKKFGQPVVSDKSLVLPQEGGANQLLTPAQAAARFHIPEYLLRKACSEGRLEHLRVVNSLWLAPATVATFARSWRTKNGRNS